MSALDLVRMIEIPVEHDGLSYRGQALAQLQRAGLPAPVILAAVQSVLRAAVDAKAEALRSSIATGGAGQAMEYQEAQAQAFAALAAPDGATAEQYPMLAASVGIDIDPSTGEPAVDILGAARSVRAAYGFWLAAGAGIRKARLSGKKAIDEAATVEAAAAACDAVVWPTLG